MQTFKEWVEESKTQIKEYISTLPTTIKLVIINVGDDPASKSYINGKLKDCAECGITTELLHYDTWVDPYTVYTKLTELMLDKTVTGVIVQLPLPENFDVEKITNLISPEKDVDGFTKGHLVDPATPAGVIEFLKAQKFIFKDINAVVIGRSNIVGKPLARLLTNENANVTLLHSKTSERNKRLFLENADLICSATGTRNVVDPSYKLKPSAWVIDIGMTRNEQGKICGDIEQDLPVAFMNHNPGSTGLATRLMLLVNLTKLYKIQLLKSYKYAHERTHERCY